MDSGQICKYVRNRKTNFDLLKNLFNATVAPQYQNQKQATAHATPWASLRKCVLCIRQHSDAKKHCTWLCHQFY